MGIYMSSHAMIGVKFIPTVKRDNVRVRGCNHAESQENFCSNCGNKMWVKEIKITKQFEYIHEDFLDPVLEKIKTCFDGYAVLDWDFEAENYYIGYGATVEDHQVAQIPLLDYNIVRDKLKIILEEYDVWDQCKESFGLWVVSTGR